MQTADAILVTGHRGLVGSALVRRLQAEGFQNILTATREELDLRDPEQVSQWFHARRPRFVFHAAGTVGGIVANATRPADFLHDNIMMQATVLRAAWQTGVEKLLYLGSSCIYPRACPQPMREEYLMTGPLEPTNQAYAIAKISGVIACQAYRRQYGCPFISAMPTNLYGPGDRFELEQSHVMPALVRKFHEASVTGDLRVTVWGTGTPRREFLYVDDLADACLFLMRHYDEERPINVGTGQDLTVAELADVVRAIVCPQASIQFDTEKPDGAPRKLLDVSRLHALGWRHRVALDEGVRRTYQWYQRNALACSTSDQSPV